MAETKHVMNDTWISVPAGRLVEICTAAIDRMTAEDQSTNAKIDAENMIVRERMIHQRENEITSIMAEERFTTGVFGRKHVLPPYTREEAEEIHSKRHRKNRWGIDHYDMDHNEYFSRSPNRDRIHRLKAILAVARVSQELNMDDAKVFLNKEDSQHILPYLPEHSAVAVSMMGEMGAIGTIELDITK